MILYPITRVDGWTYSKALFGRRFFLDVADLDWFVTQYAPGDKAASPLVNISQLPDLGRLPETYIGLAGFDPLRDEVVDFAGSLASAGVRTTIELHHTLIHGFANFVGVSPSAVAALVAAGTAVNDFFANTCSSSLPFAVAQRIKGTTLHIPPTVSDKLSSADKRSSHFKMLKSDCDEGMRVYYHSNGEVKYFPLILEPRKKFEKY